MTLNDDDRVRYAVRSGSRMLGPIERERCQQHPRRWRSYRWIWPIGTSPEVGDTQVIRHCIDCLDAG